MNTLEGNKLIAEFMGYSMVEHYILIPYNNIIFKHSNYPEWCQRWGDTETDDDSKCGLMLPLDIMEFHTSWDWLMPCVFKIMDDTSIYAQERQRVYSSINRDISITWQAVLQFIEWYNAQNKS